jgi:hypothetical protein
LAQRDDRINNNLTSTKERSYFNFDWSLASYAARNNNDGMYDGQLTGQERASSAYIVYLNARDTGKWIIVRLIDASESSIKRGSIETDREGGAEVNNKSNFVISLAWSNINTSFVIERIQNITNKIGPASEINNGWASNIDIARGVTDGNKSCF